MPDLVSVVTDAGLQNTLEIGRDVNVTEEMCRNHNASAKAVPPLAFPSTEPMNFLQDLFDLHSP